MKKFLALFLCVLTVVLCVAPLGAFAKDNKRSTAYKLTVGKTATAKFVYNDDDEYKWFKFTAPESAVYKFEVSNAQDTLSSIYLYSSSGKELTYAYYDDFKENVSIFYNCKKSSVYYLRFHDYIEKSYTMKLTAKKHTHSWKTQSTYKAEISENGYLEQYCTCGQERVVTIPKASKISLSKTSFVYDGKDKSVSVTVKDSKNKALKKGTDYTISGTTKAKKAGSYSVKITLKGKYTGSKTLKWNIAPQLVKSVSVTKQTSNSISLKWNKVAGATNYLVYGKSGSYYYKCASTTSTNATIKKIDGATLEGATKQYFYIVSVAENGGSSVKGEKSAVVKTITLPNKPDFDVDSWEEYEAEVSISPSDNNNIKGYQIYMCETKDGDYVKVKTVKPYSNYSTTYVTVSDLIANSTYYAKVRSYITFDGKTLYSPFSSVKSVKIADEDW